MVYHIWSNYDLKDLPFLASDVSFSFGKIISTDASGAWEFYAADLNSDGKIDVLSTSLHDDKIAWYKNALKRSK